MAGMDGYGIVTDRGYLLHVRAKGDFWEITVEWTSIGRIEESRTVRMWKIVNDPKGELIKEIVERVRGQFHKAASISEIERRLKVVAQGNTPQEIVGLMQKALE